MQIQILIGQRQKMMAKELLEFKDPAEHVSNETKQQSNMSKELIQLLSLQDKSPNDKSHRIENLCEIGWLDPFPEEEIFESTFHKDRPKALQR